MKTPKISLLEWQKRFGTEKACAEAIAKYRWPNGFVQGLGVESLFLTIDQPYPQTFSSAVRPFPF